MASLLQRLVKPARPESRYGMDWWVDQLAQSINFPYNVPGSVIQTYGPGKTSESANGDYAGHSAAMLSNGPVFTLMAVRLRLFSQIRWAFQRMNQARPGDLFAPPRLDVLNGNPLLNQWMIRDVDLAGNFYGYVDLDGKIWPLRPDWVQIMSNKPIDDYDAEIVGYAYFPGGMNKTKFENAEVFAPEEIIHWAPEPDPQAKWRGMSWLTPVLREMTADSKMTLHKEKYLDNAATPNMVVKMDVSSENFEKFVDAFEAEHEGSRNAYKTVFLNGAADLTVVGTDMKQLDFTSVQGKGETRLANAAGVHPVVAGFSEGMQGSSLNAGNFGQARRSTADILLYPLWTSAAGAIGQVIKPPIGSRVWYDARDVPFLREDAKDDAEIKALDAGTIRQLVDAGFVPESIKAAIAGGDWSLLEHSGLYSVQLQPPNTSQPAQSTASGARQLRLIRDEHEFITGAEWAVEA